MLPFKFIWTFSDICAAISVSLFIICLIIIWINGLISSFKQKRKNKEGGKN